VSKGRDVDALVYIGGGLSIEMGKQEDRKGEGGGYKLSPRKTTIHRLMDLNKTGNA
jgi:hypothetical protein